MDEGSTPERTTVAITTDAAIGPLVGLILKNLALNIVTGGVYSFWAKTAVRRFLWGHTLIAGERLEYTGTGGELFKGFLVVLVAVIFPLVVVINIVGPLAQTGDPLAIAAMAAVYLAIFYLYGVAIYRTLRYRLSRTRWRGIRFALPGGGWAFGALALGWSLAVVLTFALLHPVRRVRLWRAVVGKIQLGSQPFSFEGGAGPLYKAFLLVIGATAILFIAGGAVMVAMASNMHAGIEESRDIAPPFLALLPLLTVPLAGLYYWAAEMQYFFRCLGFQGVRFELAASRWQIVGLLLVNALILLLTFGIGHPLASLRTLRFVGAHLRTDGGADFAAVLQSVEPVPAAGEGLAEMMDVSVGV